MRNYLLTATLLTVATLSSTSILADTTHGNRYAGVNLGFFDVDGKGTSDGSVNTIEGRVGGFFNDYIAAEMRAGAGITGDTVIKNGSETDIDLNYMLGGYVRVGFPVHDQIFPYLLAGYTRAEFEVGSDSTAVTDSSIGIGIDANIANMSLSAEYINLIDKSLSGLSGFSIGFVTTF